MLRYRDIPTHTTEVLDLTSLTVDEFAALVPPFEAAFLGYMAARQEKAASVEKPSADPRRVAHPVPACDPSGQRPRQAQSRHDTVSASGWEPAAARLGLSSVHAGGRGHPPANEAAARESVDARTAGGQPGDRSATGAHRTGQ